MRKSSKVQPVPKKGAKGAKGKEGRMAATIERKQSKRSQPEVVPREEWTPDQFPTYEPVIEFDPSLVTVDLEEARTPKSENAIQIASMAKGPLAVEAIKAKRAGAGVVHDLNPYDLHLQAGWNMRNFSTPARRARIASLAKSIAEIGVRETMLAHIQGDKIVIHSGWNRLLATYHAIEKGAEIRGVPVRFGRAGENDSERMLSQIVNNDQDPLTPFEAGRVYQRLINFGWDVTEIANKAGKSITNVSALLELLELPSEIQKLVDTGVVSAYFATKTYRDSGTDGEKTLQILQTAINNAREEGSSRVMPKHTRKRAERTSQRKSRGGRTARTEMPKPPELVPVEDHESIPRIIEILRNARVQRDDETVMLTLSVVDFNDLVVLAELPEGDEAEDATMIARPVSDDEQSEIEAVEPAEETVMLSDEVPPDVDDEAA